MMVPLFHLAYLLNFNIARDRFYTKNPKINTIKFWGFIVITAYLIDPFKKIIYLII